MVPRDLPTTWVIGSKNLQESVKMNLTPAALPYEVVQRNFNKISAGKLHPKRPG